MEIGIIYNKSSFSNLADFDIQGNWAVISGVLRTPGGDSELRFKQVSNLDKLEWRIKANTADLKLEFRGIGTLYNITTIVRIANGKLFWQHQNGSGSSSDTLTVNSGDILEYIVVKNQWQYSFMVKNITSGTQVSMILPVTFTTHNLILSASSATDVLTMLKTSSQQFKPINLVVGDSITYGMAADTIANRWASVAGFDVSGSHGDTSANALPLLDEIINVIQPRRVIYAMGTNDQNIESWKVNLQSFKSQVEAQNIIFIPITPYANSTKSMQAHHDYIVANFPKYFDVFEATKASGSTNMNPAYVTDGVHPNTAGHVAIGNYIKASPYYNVNIPVPNLGNEGVLINTLNSWFI